MVSNTLAMFATLESVAACLHRTVSNLRYTWPFTVGPNAQQALTIEACSRS